MLQEDLVLVLSTIKNQKALKVHSTKAISTQQLSSTMNWELGYDHDADILTTDTGFL